MNRSNTPKRNRPLSSLIAESQSKSIRNFEITSSADNLSSASSFSNRAMESSHDSSCNFFFYSRPLLIVKTVFTVFVRFIIYIY